MVHRDEVEDAEVDWVEIRTERAAPGAEGSQCTRMLALAHLIRTMAMKAEKDMREMMDLGRQLSQFLFYRKKK